MCIFFSYIFFYISPTPTPTGEGRASHLPPPQGGGGVLTLPGGVWGPLSPGTLPCPARGGALRPWSIYIYIYIHAANICLAWARPGQERQRGVGGGVALGRGPAQGHPRSRPGPGPCRFVLSLLEYICTYDPTTKPQTMDTWQNIWKYIQIYTNMNKNARTFRNIWKYIQK